MIVFEVVVCSRKEFFEGTAMNFRVSILEGMDHAQLVRDAGSVLVWKMHDPTVSEIALLSGKQAFARAAIVLRTIMLTEIKDSKEHDPDKMLAVFEAYRRQANVYITEFGVTRRQLALMMTLKRAVSKPLAERKVYKAAVRKERRRTRGKRKQK